MDTRKRLLSDRSGEQVSLTPKVFDTLLFLVVNQGRLVEKDELMSAVWPDSVVEENNLNKNISILRRVLGDTLRDHKFIVTVPGRGFKFVADVEIEQDRRAAAIDPRRPKERDRAGRRWVTIAVAAVAIGLFIAAGSIYLRTSVATDAAPRTVAILPFKPMVADARDEALELGMTDTLISRLANDRDIAIRPLSAVRRFADLDQDAAEAGRALNVGSVVDGNIQHSGDRIRVNVRLVRVADGKVLWADTFDEQFADLFVVQDAISRRLATALAFRLGSEGKEQLAKHSTEDVVAYQAYLRGRFHFEKYTPKDSVKAVAYLDEAIARDPNFALAYVYLAAVYSGLAGSKDFPRTETVLKAKENARRALEIDDQLSAAHEVYGYLLFRYEYDYVGGEREVKSAIDLDPSNASAHETYGGILILLGRHTEALAEMRSAAEIDPLSASISASMGDALRFARRYDNAVAQYKKALDLDGYLRTAFNGLAVTYQLQGNDRESVESRARIEEISGDPTGAAFMRESFARGGWQGFLRAMTENENAPQMQPYVRASFLAELGKNDKAFDILNELYEGRSSYMVMLKVDPSFDPLRADPRFAELLKRMNLE